MVTRQTFLAFVSVHYIERKGERKKRGKGKKTTVSMALLFKDDLNRSVLFLVKVIYVQKTVIKKKSFVIYYLNKTNIFSATFNAVGSYDGEKHDRRSIIFLKRLLVFSERLRPYYSDPLYISCTMCTLLRLLPYRLLALC